MTRASNPRKKKFNLPRIFGKKDKQVPVTKSYDSPLYSSSVEFQGNPNFASSPVLRKSFSDANLRIGSARFDDYPTIHSPVNTEAYRIFVATWNVGGNTPHDDMNLNNFLPSDDHSDIYVFGFQEIVPLNAGNVLVIEDIEPATRWLSLINQTLNGTADVDNDNCLRTTSPTSNSFVQAPSVKPTFSRELKLPGGPLFFQPSLKTVSRTFRTEQGRRLKSCNCPLDGSRKYREACFTCHHNPISDGESSDEEETRTYSVTGLTAAVTEAKLQKYSLIACKQMVGIFVTVWVRREIVQYIGHLRLSCVGRGIMGYLGNKGCISVSMSLHQTSFCFVCSHLASGEKEGDELRRNSDVTEILKNTQFRKICNRSNRRFPDKILEHDRVIWLGDLNYRIALSYYETKNLLEDNDWDALYEKDQLKIEREAGRVLEGWNEGKINFAPTYKYSNNSDTYAGETATSKKKRRTPAWCDRILWHGDGIVQVSYIRGESKFSDHRPVCAAFVVEAGSTDENQKKAAPNLKVGTEERSYLEAKVMYHKTYE